MNGLTWANGGAAILWSGLGFLLLAMAIFGAGQWLRRSRALRRQLAIEDLDIAAGRATRAMDLGDLVISPELERHAAWQAGRLRETRAELPAVRCHRHRTGSTAFPCTCQTPGGDQ